MGLLRSVPCVVVVSLIAPLRFDVGKSKRPLIASGLESLPVYNRAYTAGSPAPLIAWHLHAKQQQARAPRRVKLSAAVPKPRLVERYSSKRQYIALNHPRKSKSGPFLPVFSSAALRRHFATSA